MVSICMLVTTEPGTYLDVADKITKIKGVKLAFAASGIWDVIAYIEVEDLKQVSSIAFQINEIPKVADTETLVEVLLGG